MKTKTELREAILATRKPTPKNPEGYPHAPRELLLAYAYVRGVPYHDVELRHRLDNPPSVTRISDYADAPVELLQVWLKVPASPLALAYDAMAHGKNLVDKAKRKRRFLHEQERKRYLAAQETRRELPAADPAETESDRMLTAADITLEPPACPEKAAS